MFLPTVGKTVGLMSDVTSTRFASLSYYPRSHFVAPAMNKASKKDQKKIKETCQSHPISSGNNPPTEASHP